MKFFLKIEKMIKKLFIIIFLILPISCQSVKDGLSGKKYESSDEFLVIKKNVNIEKEAILKGKKFFCLFLCFIKRFYSSIE